MVNTPGFHPGIRGFEPRRRFIKKGKMQIQTLKKALSVAIIIIAAACTSSQSKQTLLSIPNSYRHILDATIQKEIIQSRYSINGEASKLLDVAIKEITDELPFRPKVYVYSGPQVGLISGKLYINEADINKLNYDAELYALALLLLSESKLNAVEEELYEMFAPEEIVHSLNYSNSTRKAEIAEYVFKVSIKSAEKLNLKEVEDAIDILLKKELDPFMLSSLIFERGFFEAEKISLSKDELIEMIRKMKSETALEFKSKTHGNKLLKELKDIINSNE